MISQLSAKYQIGAIHTADTRPTWWFVTESEKVHRLNPPSVQSQFGYKLNRCSRRFQIVSWPNLTYFKLNSSVGINSNRDTGLWRVYNNTTRLRRSLWLSPLGDARSSIHRQHILFRVSSLWRVSIHKNAYWEEPIRLLRLTSIEFRYVLTTEVQLSL